MNHYFIDGKNCFESDFSPEEYKFFKEKKYIGLKGNEFKINICGIVNFKKKNYIFFPKGYEIRTSNKENNIIASFLFQSIMKYKGDVLLDDEEKDWLGDKNPEINFLDTLVWLIEDYLANGFYRVSQKIIEDNGKGRIEWTKTIKSKLPFIKDNDFLYLDVLTSRNNVNLDHIITKIHKNIVFECIEEIGWVLSITDSVEKLEDLNISKDQQIILLEKKLKETFVGHDIKLLQNLISYLKRTVNDNTDFALVTPKFENIWEEMLKLIFENDESIKIPQPYWKRVKTHYPDNKKQIPDILVKYEKEIVVLDAKYYSVKGSFPGWKDIVKQLFYALSLDSNYNIFLFPESLEINNNFSYHGYSSVDGKESEFKYVHAFSIDVKDSLKHYVHNINNKKLFNDIVECVEVKNGELNNE